MKTLTCTKQYQLQQLTSREQMDFALWDPVINRCLLRLELVNSLMLTFSHNVSDCMIAKK